MPSSCRASSHSTTLNGQRRIVGSAELDVDRYQRLLDAPYLTDDERSEFLKALWSIVIAFIDLGYGVHPAQQVLTKADHDREFAMIAEELFRSAA